MDRLDPLPFQELEEALGDGIIMAIPMSAHAGNQIVFTEKRLPLLAGELRALVGMDHGFGLWFRRQTALSNACKARPVVMRDCMDHLLADNGLPLQTMRGRRRIVRTGQ